MRFRVIALAFAALLACSVVWADDSEGRSLYLRHCAVCHGERGDGQGPAAYLLFPRPRDLTTAQYRFKSTPQDSLPRDEDLLRTITEGLPGTAMPPWRDLPEPERRAIVYYLKTLSPRFASEKPEPPVEIGPEPPLSSEGMARGRQLYQRMGCFQCHGPSGRGDGPAAATLRDGAGMPSIPYDFTRPGAMKGGSSPRDLYRTLTTGLIGTPMPSYAAAMDDRSRWELSLYVVSLRSSEPAPRRSGPIIAKRLPSLPLDLQDPAWDRIAATSSELRPLWQGATARGPLLVRAAWDGERIAVLLEWPDASSNERWFRHEDFRDAAAVQWPLRTQRPTPFFGMGLRGEPVNIWHWKADWQAGLGRRPAVVYANAVADSQRGADESFFLTGRAAGNPMSNVERSSACEEANASGLGTLTTQPAASQDCQAAGAWRDGRWRVLFVRALHTGDALDAALGAAELPVAFAVWDGSMGDRGGKKAVTTWQTLRIEAFQPRSNWMPLLMLAGAFAAVSAVVLAGVVRRRSRLSQPP